MSGLISRTFFYTIWFNLRYLPLEQAKHFPIIIHDVKIFGHPKIEIHSKLIKPGMIHIGRLGMNVWNGINLSTLTFYGRGKIIFNGSAKLTNSVHIRVLDEGILEIGDAFYTSSNLNLHCAKRIVIGSYVTLGWDVMIMDTDYHHYWLDNENMLAPHKKEVSIGSNCWIGSKTIITKGTYLVNHTIVGAGSVVSGIFKNTNVIIKGNPATLVRTGVSIKEDFFW